MILAALIFIPMAGGLLAWMADRWYPGAAKWFALVTAGIEFVLAIWLWLQSASAMALPAHGGWLGETRAEWIPRFGVSFHLAVDGISLVLVVLTAFLAIVSVACSWTEIQKRVGFFYFNLLWTVAGSVGVFFALDLFLFFFFWELMLVPMYFLIGIWGHENRQYASIKFFIFAQGSGMFMLVAILALVFVHYRSTGVLTFDYFDLLNATLSPSAELWIMLGFFIAFAVKTPIVPFHTWLPDAHTEAPTAGSVILAGVLLKTGAYGLLRFIVPLFPEAAAHFAPVAMVLGATGILYGAFLAFAQTDFKRLVAYTSVSHLGFAVVGIFAWNPWSLGGAVMQMMAHGISTGALFVVAGILQERTHTRDMQRYEGLWSVVPRLAGMGLFFAIAALGLPGMGNFVGEFLVLMGLSTSSSVLASVATVVFVASVVYALALVQKTFHGENKHGWQLHDLSGREMATLFSMVAITLWLGLYPQPVLNAAPNTANSPPAIAVAHHEVNVE